jgi:hypothetical protein
MAMAVRALAKSEDGTCGVRSMSASGTETIRVAADGRAFAGCSASALYLASR